MSLTVLIAPSGFKECLDAYDVAEAMAEGVSRAWPDATILKAPVPDGGEGFTQALVRTTNGKLYPVTVTGPLGQQIDSFVGFLGDSEERTAVIEIAAACGLSLVPRNRRNPALTTSYGVGELIRVALDMGAERILVGCGDSGVNDGGAGMVQALGGRLLDRKGRELRRGGAALADLDVINLAGLDPRLADVAIDVTVNWHNGLIGERGVTRVYGAQKGATPKQIEVLETAMVRYAARIKDLTGVDVANMKGTGASGGMGAAFAGLLGSQLHPRYEILMQYLHFDDLLGQADLVLTAEGSIDTQTPFGKVPTEVGRRATALGIPVIALAGTVGSGARANLAHGISAFGSILVAPCTLDDAIAGARDLIADAAEQTTRMLGVGRSIATRRSRHLSERPRPRRAGRAQLTLVS